MGTFGDILKTGAELLLGTGINKGLGAIGTAAEDKRQLEQQKKLQQLAIAGSKEMGEFNTRQQMEIWNATNYQAQIAEMKKAGLNPALMYKQGGGGGTTGSSSMGISAATAANAAQTQSAKNEQALAAAQIANITAQTEKTKAETVKIEGVDTDLGKQQITNLQQQINESIANIKNKEAQTALTKTQNNIAKISESIANETREDQEDQIKWLAMTARENFTKAFNEAWISQKTQQTQIKLVEQQLIALEVGINLQRSNIDLNKSKITEIANEIAQKWQQVSQGWQGLNNEQQALKIKDFEAGIKANYPSMQNLIGGSIAQTANKIAHWINGEKYNEKESWIKTK